MIDNVDVRERIVQILRSVGPKEARIHDSIRIYHDLLISGDDAVELLERVHNAFGTRFDGFTFETYFPDETESISTRIAKFFGINDGKREFTFKHLLSVVDRGAWFDP
jgi:Protein of unknown function (DUF1493)